MTQEDERKCWKCPHRVVVPLRNRSGFRAQSGVKCTRPKGSLCVRVDVRGSESDE